MMFTFMGMALGWGHLISGTTWEHHWVFRLGRCRELNCAILAGILTMLVSLLFQIVNIWEAWPWCGNVKEQCAFSKSHLIASALAVTMNEVTIIFMYFFCQWFFGNSNPRANRAAENAVTGDEEAPSNDNVDDGAIFGNFPKRGFDEGEVSTTDCEDVEDDQEGTEFVVESDHEEDNSTDPSAQEVDLEISREEKDDEVH